MKIMRERERAAAQVWPALVAAVEAATRRATLAVTLAALAAVISMKSRFSKMSCGMKKGGEGG